MDIRQLKTFLIIAKLQSFTLAAQSLDYAQSTITTQIQLLERELKVKLFERLGRSITLTQEGKKLIPFAEQIVKLSKEAKDAMSTSNVPSGTLAIGAVESICVMRLPKILKEYRSRYPQVEIVLKFGGTSDFMPLLKENAIDIAFFLDKKIDAEEFVTEIQFPEPMAVLSAPEHPLAGKKKVYPEDLNGETLIVTEAGCSYRQIFEKMLTAYGIKPHAYIETGNVQAIKQLVMSEMGITFLPLIAAEEECHQKRLTQLNWQEPSFEVFTQVLYHKSKWISAPLKAFIELIHEMKF